MLILLARNSTSPLVLGVRGIVPVVCSTVLLYPQTGPAQQEFEWGGGGGAQA